MMRKKCDQHFVSFSLWEFVNMLKRRAIHCSKKIMTEDQDKKSQMFVFSRNILGYKIFTYSYRKKKGMKGMLMTKF